MISLLLALLALGSHGDHRKGEIEIVDDPVQVEKIEQVQHQRLLKKGFSEEQAKEFSKTGIVTEDQYWVWTRDAVLFPKGIPGTYNRMMWKNSGVAVLPILPSGKIALNLNFRHATRSWELELPRGGALPDESLEDAAKRELSEETGYEVSKLIFLGNIACDTGMLSGVTPVFLGQISHQGDANQEESEAIAKVVELTVEEIKKGLICGEIEIENFGKVPLRDAFLTFALYQADIRKLL